MIDKFSGVFVLFVSAFVTAIIIAEILIYLFIKLICLISHYFAKKKFNEAINRKIRARSKL